MESFNALQEDINSKMWKGLTNFKKSPKERLTKSYIETRLDNLEKQWSLFTETHTQIVTQIKRTELQNSDYYKKGLYDEVEELYVSYKCDLKEMLLKMEAPVASSVVPETCQSEKVVTRVKLPEIKIPVFSGKYSEWPTFRDLFLGLIHSNKLLEDSQKFYYLKGHLTGEAELLLRNISVTADNYKSAWEQLDCTCNNKKFLINGILKRLFSQKTLMSESASDIKTLLNTTSECLQSIKTLGVDISSWDILIIYIISGKLDGETRRAWELKVSSDNSDELATFKQFTEFLSSRFRGLEYLDSKSDAQTRGRHPKSTQSFHVLNKDKQISSCEYCSADHKIAYCSKFGKQSSENRRHFVQDRHLCFICLKSNHSAKVCKNTQRCQVCKRRHHSLLHPTGVSGSKGEGYENNVNKGTSSTNIEEVKEDNGTAQAEGSNKAVISCLSTGGGRKTVLLSTALVKAESKDGACRTLRALLDQGSQGSFVTESAVQYLGLKKAAANHTVIGVGGNKGEIVRYTVTINVKSRRDPNFVIRVNAYVLKSVTALLPVTKVTRVEWVDLTDADLADPEYYRPNKIDILLGAEVYGQIIQEGIKRNLSGNLLAQDTALGWILSGVCEVENKAKIYSHVTVMHSSIQEDDLLKRFWELENEPLRTKKMLTEEEMECEKLFVATTKRNEEGRYIVRLPLRDAKLFHNYGESKSIAEKRLKSLEVKLGNNSKLKNDYTKVIKEYLDLGHMVKVNNKETDKSAIYLPHHAVIREDKSTTKVRVVFDASCKGSNGMSLNDNMLVGPTLQAELRHTIMRWRMYKICLVADIIKMYRQVLVDRQDTRFQRILWRDNPAGEIEEYELLTVTFGTASAPYLAVRCLQQTAYDECENDPEMARIVLNHFYMDDLMVGADNIDAGYEIYTKLREVLSKGGFKLQKWNSNSRELLEVIMDKKDTIEERVTITKDTITKVLGLTWDPNDDVFQYSVELPALEEPVTKRKVISNISRLFDPLGWLAPSIILAKKFIQKLWLSGLNWDQEIPNNLLKEWNTYHDQLTALSNVKIPRWYHTHSETVKTELHGFSDASKTAYASVIYLRTIDSVGTVHVSLVTAKTKVAPIKQISIPRLELCGAGLTAKLIAEVAEVLVVPKKDWHAWTDSEVVLAWLNSHPSRWKTFVANRVSDILTTLDANQWSHVSSKLNPADCASRGISPAELEDTYMWWKGTQFLAQAVIDYKKPKHRVTHLEEVKVHITVIDMSFWNRFSSLSRLVRVLSYCRRFLRARSQLRNDSGTRELSKQELADSMELCIKTCQQEGFLVELEELKGNKSFKPKRKNLKSLNIFLDSKGILRVGGRLEMSDLSYDRIHPILIPKDSFLTRLLIAEAHAKTMHGGPQLMITYLRSKYWIMGAKLLTKKFVRGCVTCIRYAAKTSAQLMGQVPSVRLKPSKPFFSTGVDYAGPINIRVSKGRGNKSYKGYIALFICMSTRAVHLEAVSELSTKGFMAAFKRFVARRGRVANLYSDNATNFVGAARELLHLFNDQKSNINSELAEYLSTDGIQWHFIPPHAPNFGGLWEAGIKSTKHHLRRVIGNSTLTFEEMATVLAQIEACLNSRPLSYVEDENKLTILTPGHFLVGEPLVMVPEMDYIHQKVGNLQRWQVYQRMTQDFWKRWSNDYLNQFLQRHKWTHQNPEPTVGDLVLIKEDDMPPGKWLLGKILQKHPGPDGMSRVVTLRTQTSTIKRPVSKLCLLPTAK